MTTSTAAMPVTSPPWLLEKSGVVAQGLALLPHSKKVVGLISHLGQGLSVWSLHVLPVFTWVSSGCSGFPHHQNMYVGLSPVSTLEVLAQNLEFPGLCCGSPLLLRDGLNAETKFHCTLYVTSNIPLPLNNTAKISNFVNIHLCRAIWVVILEDSITSEALSQNVLI